MANLRPKNQIKFPDSFLWGTATAAHQIEGQNTASDWWSWEASGRLKEKSGRACDSWRLWRKDVDLAKFLHTNAYRFSIEWARIEPIEGKFDPAALDHYSRQLAYLHRLGLKAMVTLWHFTLPAWFARKGGFENSANLKYFSRYVEFVVKNLSATPDFWVTLNEPNNVYVTSAHLWGIWPPGKKSVLSFLRVYFNLVKAHRLAYRVIHKSSKAPVGTAQAMLSFENFSRNPLAGLVARLADLTINKLFLNLISHHLDFVGLNYYQAHLIKLSDLFILNKPITARAGKEMQLGQRSDLGWQIYPQGIYKLVMSLARYNLPIYITENGIADQADTKRGRYIVDHLIWLGQAIKEGADVRGYFHWTLMDNFEWSSGYAPKFGLFETNYKTFRRTPRPSAKLYAKICHENSITANS